MKNFLFLIFLISSSTLLDAKIKVGETLVTGSNEHYLSYVRYITVPQHFQNGEAWENGNDIEGKSPAEIEQIVAQIKLKEFNVLRVIYERMASTPNEIFHFSSTLHASSSMTQRLETIQMMKSFNNGRYGYGPPYTSSSSLWEKGPTTPFYFRQKGGTAYQAIVDLCAIGAETNGECFGAIIACIWWGASQGMGETLFNQLYPGNNALNMDYKASDSFKRNLVESTDFGDSYHIPGDWLYIRNHNYQSAISSPEFYKKGWLTQKDSYPWSGENAIFLGYGSEGQALHGEARYEGLGLENLTAEEMREKLRENYNEDLSQIIANQGSVNGVPITFLQPRDAATKIIWTNVRRVKH